MKNRVSLLHHKLSIHFSVPAAKKRNQNISKCKRNLHYINDQQLKHIRTKNKCNWYEDGKKYSKFFSESLNRAIQNQIHLLKISEKEVKH